MVQAAAQRLVTEATLPGFLASINTALTTLQSQMAAIGDPTKLPVIFYATGSTYGGRPVTPRPVWWMSWDVAPPTGIGTVTSGSGPVPDLDFVFVAPGVVTG